MSRGSIIFQPYCSCGNSIGRRQYMFEDLLEKGFSKTQAAKECGFIKMCCLGNTLNAPIHYIVSYDEERVRDETNHYDRSSKIVYKKYTNLIQPTEIPPSFPSYVGSFKSSFTVEEEKEDAKNIVPGVNISDSLMPGIPRAQIDALPVQNTVRNQPSFFAQIMNSVGNNTSKNFQLPVVK